MKKTLLCFAAVSSLALTAMPAAAQAWQNINQRQAALDARIDQGVRSGSLTRSEAVNLRTEFRGIALLESRYRATNGLSMTERADLDRRFNILSAKIRIERADRQDRGDRRWYDNQGRWQNINQRQVELDRRIDQGIRSGQLSRPEAMRLRAEFQTIARLETTYRRNGLTNAERSDLDRRFDILSMKIRDERRDRDGRRG